MNNYERIKAMSIEEMAELFNDFAEQLKEVAENQTGLILREKSQNYIKKMKQWLESESEVEE